MIISLSILIISSVFFDCHLQYSLSLMEETSAATDERSDYCRPPGPRAVPWLLFSHGKLGKNQAFYNLCEPNKTYLKSIPEMSQKSYFQSPSHQGWLIITFDEEERKADDDADEYYSNSSSKWKFGDCFLWNPVSLETIELPNLLQWINKSDQYFLRDCVLSSPPGNPDSMAFVLFSGDDCSIPDLLVYCRPGDNQWRTQELSGSYDNALSLFCIKRKLYVRCLDHWYLAEVEKSRPHDDDKTLSIRSLDLIEEPSLGPLHRVVGAAPCRIREYVQSCDELFMVVRVYDPVTQVKELASLEVFRMDFSSMAWEEVKELGDHVLFLGEANSASCSAADLGLTRGCVYYTQPKDQNLYAFDLEDGTISISLPCPNLPRPWLSPDWVIISTTLRVAEEEDIIEEAEQNQTNVKNDDMDEKAQKNNGGELKEARTLGILNQDILRLIASYLHPVDYMHFRAACRENRLAIPAMNWITSLTEITQSTYLSPWLVFLRKNDAIYNFIDPMHNNEKYLMDRSELLLDAQIRFSKGGWLLMSKGLETLFFFNPFTKAMIQLPDIPDDWVYAFPAICFSSSPTSSDCVVFAITQWNKDSVLIFFISRGDDCWSREIGSYARESSKKKYVEFKPSRNPVFYDRGFFCLDSRGRLVIFSANEDFDREVVAMPQRPCGSHYQCFLVECEGKLLSVFVGHVGKWVRVFRLDFSKMVWVEVKSLGKHMLFVCNTSCISAIAPVSCMENKIYFPRYHGEGIMFYSFDTCRYHSLESSHSAQDFFNSKELLYCSWIEPNWSQTATVQELDWLSI